MAPLAKTKRLYSSAVRPPPSGIACGRSGLAKRCFAWRYAPPDLTPAELWPHKGTAPQLIAAKLQDIAGNLCGRPTERVRLFSKGGDPAAPSDTATLLRLHPSHEPHRGKRPPCG